VLLNAGVWGGKWQGGIVSKHFCQPLTDLSSNCQPSSSQHAKPKGAKADAACEAVPVKAFPTWVIGGRVIEGELDLDELEEMLNSDQRAAAAPASAAAPAAAS